MDLKELFIEKKIPQPLEKQELHKYLVLMRNGDENARDIIIIHNIRLVISQVLKIVSYSSCDKNDLISEGMIGLIKAVDSYDVNKNYEFSSYAARCIENQIYRFLNNYNKTISNLSTEELFLEKGVEVTDFDDSLDEKYEEKDLKRRLIEVINSLNIMDKDIINSLYFNSDKKVTQKDLARKYNVSTQFILRRKFKALKLIKQELLGTSIIVETKKVK